jgi:hypothetical protein
MREEGLISSSPRRIMTFVAGSLVCVRKERCWMFGEGKGKEGKGRINAAAYTTGNAFVSATGQWGWDVQ